MYGEFQTSIMRPVTLTGTALHSGKQSTMTLRPAAPDTGIVWRRIDLTGSPSIQATPGNVVNTQRCTVIGHNGAIVRTVEHVMAALRGLAIDNCLIDLEGEEPPAADGSAASFVELIQRAGIDTLPLHRDAIVLSEPVVASEGASSLIALPHDRLSITCVFANDHKHPALSDEFAEYDIEPATFVSEIAPARTIGFMKEIEQLHKDGLGLGGSLDIAVVIGEDRILTPLRFPNELVRHKILDLVGDLALLGHLRAKIVAIRPSHRLNALLASRIAEQLGLVGQVFKTH